MIFPKLKGLTSPDLPDGELPSDIENCAVLVDAQIGGEGEGADTFSFTVVTPEFLKTEGSTQWGRGSLILPTFSWSAVEAAVERLLSHAARETWEQVAQELAKELRWEFENYSGG